ncbi:MAG: TerC family protein [Planctomycetes bacterium]|nr:TerC family protein [Planctomycetota bacterium]
MRGLIAGILVLIVARAVFAADTETKPSTGTSFRFEKRDGQKFTGKITNAILIKTESGKQEVEPSHIRRITLGPVGEVMGDVIELSDKTQVRGKIDAPAINVPVDGNEVIQVVELATIREIKASSEISTGLAAILIGLLTLTAMEIVLGIDNVIFLAILAGKLPPEKQPRARKLGLAAALGTRLLLLATLSFLIGLTKPLFTLPDLPLMHNLEAREVSLRDLVLLIGGMFLIGKSVLEMHEKIEMSGHKETAKPATPPSFGKVLVQIAIIDIVFSLDSVITAVGMVEELWVMVAAMIISMLVMLVFASTISDFVAKHPTLKVLALSFLILIGVMLVAEALGQHMDKGYIYFAMAFAVVVEMINLRLRHTPVDKPLAA